MNKSFDSFKHRILNLISIFAPGLLRISRTTKIVIVFFAAALVILPVIFAARSCLTGKVKPTGYAVRLKPLSSKDTAGDLWVIELLVGQPSFYYSSSKLKPGPPLLVCASVELKGPDALIGLEIKGQADERYSGVVMKNCQPIEPPKFDIVDKKGHIVASGQFKYG